MKKINRLTQKQMVVYFLKQMAISEQMVAHF